MREEAKKIDTCDRKFTADHRSSPNPYDPVSPAKKSLDISGAESLQ
jgi:hypothetical protein